jgi:hypothetical protein
VSLNLFVRKVHYWLSAAIAIPALVLIASGLLLQCKKEWSWVQPPERRGTGSEPRIDFAAILDSVRTVPGFESCTWDDVNRLDVRPSRGLVKVQLRSEYEVQVDLGTGSVLQSAYRRSDLIESIHDGSFFAGAWTKLGVFLPTGLALLLLWGTGVWLWWLPFSRRRGRRLAARAGCAPPR